MVLLIYSMYVLYVLFVPNSYKIYAYKLIKSTKNMNLEIYLIGQKYVGIHKADSRRRSLKL